jgi:hypothetical protein
MSSDYELSDEDIEYSSDEEMIDGTQDDYGELNLLLIFRPRGFNVERLR